MSTPLQIFPLLAQDGGAGESPAAGQNAEATAPPDAGQSATDAGGSTEAGASGESESAIVEQPAKKAPQGDPSPLTSLVPLILMGFAFYMILIRPQSKERRRHDDLLKALKKNDRVVTAGGIIGTVANLSADGREVTIKVDDNARLRVLRSSISSIYTDTPDEKNSTTQPS